MYWLDNLSIAKKIEDIYDKINKTNPEDIFYGFKKMPVAICISNMVYILFSEVQFKDFKKEGCYQIKEKDSRFEDCSVAYIENNYVGVVNIDELKHTLSFEAFIGKVFRAMYHAHQLETNEKRFTDELMLIDYPFDEEIINLWLLERHYLLKALVSRYGLNKERFMKARMIRKQKLDKYLNYDAAIESFEGVASYVEYRAYANMLKEKDAYIVALKGYELAKQDFSRKNYREMLENQGLFMGLLLDDLYPEWQATYHSSDNYLYTLLRDAFNYENVEIEIDLFKGLAKGLIKREKENINLLNKEFNELAKHSIVLKGNIAAESMDPSKFTLCEDGIIHNSFLKINLFDKTIHLDGPIKTIYGTHMFEIKELTIPYKEKIKIKTNQIECELLGKIRGNISKKGNKIYVDIK